MDGVVVLRVVDEDALLGLEVDRVKLKRSISGLVPVHNPKRVKPLLLHGEIEGTIVWPLPVAEQGQLEVADFLREPIAWAGGGEDLEAILVVLVRLADVDGQPEAVCARFEREVGEDFRTEIGVVILLAGDAREKVIELKVAERGAVLLKIDQLNQIKPTVSLAGKGGVFDCVTLVVLEDALELMDGALEVVLDCGFGRCLRGADEKTGLGPGIDWQGGGGW